MKATIESIASETILQSPKKMKIKGVEYSIAKPTTATLIRVSSLISKLPPVVLTDKVLVETLSIAKDCEVIGEIAATLILGAKRQNIFSPFHNWRNKKLSKSILHDLSPGEVNSLMLDILKDMEVSLFFSSITFLLEVNLLRKTKA